MYFVELCANKSNHMIQARVLEFIHGMNQALAPVTTYTPTLL